MTSVPFCNLGDVYPGWTGSDDFNEKLKKNLNMKFPEDIRMQSNEKEKEQQKKENEWNNEMKKETKDELAKVPPLNTFKNAIGCEARNNSFQDTAANNILRTNQNPLVYNNVQQVPQQYYMGYPETNQYPFQMQYSYGSQYPQNQILMYPNNILPVYQMNNMWPQQMWNTYEPSPYHNTNPYGKYYGNYGMVGQQGNMIESFDGSSYITNDTNDMNMDISNMLQVLIMILAFLCIIQLLDILK